ncbi:MAG: hypothetical protein NTZ63_03420 [Candidatus Omnitrophica bacterium]|nr:hypothetical protein [Candidatus Omnitrophota bacterium]
MKKLPMVLLGAGVILLVGAVVGRFVGNPRTFMGVKILTTITLANTVLLLAIAAKLFEKK